MFWKSGLLLGHARCALETVFSEVEKDQRPIAAAVVDERGSLIGCARMDGASARLLEMSIRKAYTAAVMGMDTAQFHKKLQERDYQPPDYGDSTLLTRVQGGVTIKSDGAIIGGIGVTGTPSARD